MSNEPYALCRVEKYFPDDMCYIAGTCGDSMKEKGLLDVFGHQSWVLPIEKFCKYLAFSISQSIKKICLSPPDIGVDNAIYDCGFYARLEAGGRHMLHADAVKLDGSPNHTSHRVSSMIIYLRTGNEDFHGGEIVFPMLDEIITPIRGTMLSWPATLGYQHEVKPVLRGVRDSIVVFYKKGPRSESDPTDEELSQRFTYGRTGEERDRNAARPTKKP